MIILLVSFGALLLIDLITRTRQMATIADVQASLSQLASDVALLQRPAATPADLDAVKASVDAADASVRAILAP